VKRNGFAPVLIIIIIAVILSVGFFFVKSDLKNSIFPNLPSSSSSSLATSTPSQINLFMGKVTKLDQDLGLFKETEDMKLNGTFGGFIYYSAGQFATGDLKGYTRIIATEPQNGPGSPIIYTLATKDFKMYVLDDPDNATTSYPDDAYQNPYSNLDKSKIASIATFDTNQPQSISLNDRFSLYRNGFLTTEVESNTKDGNGYPFQNTMIQTDFSSLQKLTSPNNNLTMYFQNEKDSNNKYILGNTTVVVVDPTGLPIVYSLASPKAISDYEAQLKVYNTAWEKYQYEVDEYKQKKISSSPQPPNINISFSPLGFGASDILNSTGLTFYKDYEVAFPDECAQSMDPRVVNVSDSDLEQIGTVNGFALYRPKDQNGDLNTLQYHVKMDEWASDPTDFANSNPGMTEPTNVSDYSKDNPLLFVKDYWGRWIAFGEWDIKLIGGCGKPVIYLYPTKDTKVTLKFNAPVSFTTDIPTYGGYWQVLAHNDGALTNLRPELTNCNTNYSEVGSEYAKEACLTNNYPYLYWSGNITSVDYPKINQGWIVSKDNLKNFIDSKLTFMGLNEKERNDFESYWIPEMLWKDTPYYRVSFLTTPQLNQMFPMMVTPVPDTIFRIFLDWQPLNQKPVSSLQPEVLPQLIRSGFTMVEWGGLKLP
jgi:hypothetical protein